MDNKKSEEMKAFVKEEVEEEAKIKFDYLSGIYEYCITLTDNDYEDWSDEQEKEGDRLAQLTNEGKMSLMDFLQGEEIDDYEACYAISTYLYDCQGHGDERLLLKVLERNFSHECYIEILENMYLGVYNT